MAQAQMQAQFGAWVEGATPKRDGKGNRKEWVTDPRKVAGERVRLSVIARDGERERHVLTLDVDTAEARANARVALLAALKALDVADKSVPAVKAPAAPQPAAPQPAAPKLVAVPTAAPTRTPRTVDAKGKPTLLAQIGKPAQATTHKPAPAKVATPAAADLGWFASLMGGE